MTISETSCKLEELSYVEGAGAAPTDKGNIPCFQVKLMHAAEMNDSNEEEVRTIVKDGMDGEFDGELVVQSSKEVIDEGTEHEIACFWVYAYGSFGRFEKGGIEYNILSWNPDWGVEGVPTGHTNPMDGATKFKWDDVPVSQEDLE